MSVTDKGWLSNCIRALESVIRSENKKQNNRKKELKNMKQEYKNLSTGKHLENNRK